MNHKNRKKRRTKHPILKTFLVMFIAFSIIILSLSAFKLISIANNLPDWNVEDLQADETSFVFDSDDRMVVKLHSTENRVPVELADISPYVIDAFLSTEDTRFESHHGIDLKRIFGALIRDVKDMGFSQGASTITMQLARNAILENQAKKIDRKLQEMLIAFQIEQKFTKDEILNFYLNEIYFGHGANGIEAAASIYFDKTASELTISEAAILTGLARNPGTYSPFLNPENALNIRDTVVNNMVRYGKITATEGEKAKQEPLVLAEYTSGKAYPYPWFTDYVIEETENILKSNELDTTLLYTGGLKIYTTLDTDIQKNAEAAYANETLFPQENIKSNDTIQSAAVVIDNENGAIRALIGGKEHLTKRGLNRATDMKRQPGSSIKPIVVYSPALESGYTTSTLVDDTKTNFGTESNPYWPSNYDGTYQGFISVREAVKHSVNVPAVAILKDIGVQKGFDFGINMGLPLINNDKNLSLALGGISKGVSPLDMANAYSTFANQGIYTENYVIERIIDRDGFVIYEHAPQRKVAMAETTAYLMTDMLVTVVQEGTGTRAQLDRPVAGKTGTTQVPPNLLKKYSYIPAASTKDAWFVGYTPELSCAVWFGYDNDEYVDENGETYANYLNGNYRYGGKHPAMVWKAIMSKATQNMPITNFQKPENIISVPIDIKSGNLVGENTPEEYIKNELFAQDNVPTEISDYWIKIDICEESLMLATDYCPHVISAVTGKDELPEPCDLHTAPDFWEDFPEEITGDISDNGNTTENQIDPFYQPFVHKSVFSAKDKTIKLEWQSNNPPGTLFQINRWTNQKDMAVFETYGNYFEDTEINLDEKYYYQVIAKNTEEDAGIASKILIIET